MRYSAGLSTFMHPSARRPWASMPEARMVTSTRRKIYHHITSNKFVLISRSSDIGTRAILEVGIEPQSPYLPNHQDQTWRLLMHGCSACVFSCEGITNRSCQLFLDPNISYKHTHPCYQINRLYICALDLYSSEHVFCRLWGRTIANVGVIVSLLVLSR